LVVRPPWNRIRKLIHAAGRRKEALAAPLRKALHRAACAVKSQSGQALLRQRDMRLERSFEHVLDEGKVDGRGL
jgi:hypothetical protein